MARVFKLLITIVVIAGAAAAFQAGIALPYSCNVRVKRASSRVEMAFDMIGKSLRATELGRQAIDELEPCVRSNPGDVGAQMAFAAACRVVGQNQRAVEAYETALRYDNRPELYFNLGETQLAAGDTQAGVRNLTQACIYNPEYLNGLSAHYPEVRHAVDLYQVGIIEKQRRLTSH